MIIIMRQKTGSVPVEILRRRSSLFLAKNTAQTLPAEAPQSEHEHDKSLRERWVGNVGNQVRGEFRAVGAKVFAEDDLVGVSKERRVR